MAPDPSHIEGRKKGGSSGGTEAADSLRSMQTAQLVDLLSEGEIGGLVNGLKSVYFDGVPVENVDGSKNFEGLNFAIMVGTQAQPGFDGIDTVQSERAVGVVVTHVTAITQTIISADVDTVRVTISVPQLTTLDTKTGDLRGATVEYAIDIQSAGGGFVQVHREVISGKTTSNYKRATRITLPGSAPWDIRLRRITADSAASTLVNAFAWDSFTEIQSVKLRYPNSAVAGIQISARQFARIPTRAYDIFGLCIRVPSNYDPVAGAYAGVWDGSFKIAWSNNPAWVYFDLATHPRYGTGQYIKDHHLDKWALYRIGRYCDVRVPNGQGGTEPRFTCNLWLYSEVQARQALQDLAALFRAITYWGNGVIATVQDAPSDAQFLFTKANIVGEFAYESVSRKTRHSVWTIYYNDLAQLGKRVPAVYVDNDLVRQIGVVNEKFSPIGCTSRGQAMRLARWAAFSEQMGRTVAFRAGEQAASIGPGAVFKVADPNKSGKRLGGRVRSSTVSEVTLDASVTLDGGETYQLEVMLPDTTVQLGYRTEKRQVIVSAGEHQTLSVSPPFTVAPANATIWVLQPTNIQPTWWRMIGRKDVAGTSEYDVIGIEHDPDKYDAIELGLKLAPKPTSGLSIVAPLLTDVAIIETPYVMAGSARIRATVSWTAPAQGLRFALTWRLEAGPWTEVPQSSSNTIDIDGLSKGLLEVEVKSINSLGRSSLPASASRTLLGKTVPPETVNFGMPVIKPGLVRIPYAACVDPTYVATLLREGPSWDAGTALAGTGDINGYDWAWPSIGSHTVWARHFDSSGNGSTPTGVTVLVDSSILIGANVVDAPPGWLNNNAGATNQADLTWWKRDAAIPWPQNSEYNRIISVSPSAGADLLLAGPKGGDDLVWYCEEQTGNGDSGGGWNGAPLNLDPSKTYRFAIPVRRYTGAGGTMWWGIYGVQDFAGTASGNPYFVGAFRPQFDDRWYLLVGYIFPAGSGGNTHESAGVWDCKTGSKIAGGNNWRFMPNAGNIVYRAYQYYASPGAAQLMGRPVVNLVDGTESALREYFEPGALLNNSITVAGGVLQNIGTTGVQVDNTYTAIGANMVPNSDQASAISMAWAVQAVDAAFGMPLRYASDIWGDTYTLKGGSTRNLIVQQSNVAAGDAGTTVADIYPLGPWDAAHSLQIVGGKRYCASAYFQTHRCLVGVGLQWFDANGNYLGDVNTGPQNLANEGAPADTLALYTRVWAIGIAPSNAAMARLYLRKFNTKAAADSYMWLAAPQFEEINTNATGPSAYSPGPPSSVRQLGFTGDIDATKGATWGANLFGTPSNLAGLSGGEAIRNELLSPAIAAAAETANWSDVNDKPAFGTFAALSQVTYDNVNTFFAGAAIGLAHINTATIANLAALSLYTGTLTVDADGFIRMGKSVFGAGSGLFIGKIGSEYGFDLGDDNDHVRWRPSTGWVEKRNTFTASVGGGSLDVSVNNGPATYGARTVSVVAGGTPPFSYAWNIVSWSADNNSGSASFSITGGESTASVGVAGSASNNIITAVLSCSILDANGRATRAAFNVRATHGTPL